MGRSARSRRYSSDITSPATLPWCCSARLCMRHYLWKLRPYFRQVAGELVLGSLAGIVMNTAIVLPAILLGRAIDTTLALEQGQANASAVGWAALAFVGGTLLSEGPRMLKRWWL